MSIKVFFSSLLLLVAASLHANYILVNESVISEKAIGKIELLGSELNQKSGISVYIVAKNILGDKSFQDVISEFNPQPPYVVLAISRQDKKVDIFSTDGMEALFDKEGVLSPYPWTGTIIPLLTVKKESDNFTAAMLNGYADIVEQIASTKKIELVEAIGSSNKNIMNIVRFIVYATLILSILYAVYVRRKRKVGKS